MGREVVFAFEISENISKNQLDSPKNMSPDVLEAVVLGSV